MRFRLPLAALASAILLLTLPAAAGAVSVTVTNDAGQPAPLAEGSTLSIRNMAPVIAPAFGADEKRFTLEITDPAGSVDPMSASCASTANTDATRAVRYSRNGTYTLKFTTFASDEDFYCEQPGKTQVFTFAVNAFTKITPPATTLLYRKSGSGTGFKDPVFQYDLNPGATAYRLYYAYNATVTPDGGISGSNYQEMGVGIPNGSVAVAFKFTGMVTMIAKAFTNSGESPPSEPVVLTIVGPFEFRDSPGLRDSKGPTYSSVGKVDPLAAGSVITMRMARGKGKLKKVASAKIAADGSFRLKFRQRRKGVYKVRYQYAGSKFMTPGVWSARFTLKRRFVSLDNLKHVSGD